jgi:hypothetical protein
LYAGIQWQIWLQTTKNENPTARDFHESSASTQKFVSKKLFLYSVSSKTVQVCAGGFYFKETLPVSCKTVQSCEGLPGYGLQIKKVLYWGSWWLQKGNPSKVTRNPGNAKVATFKVPLKFF